MEVHHSFDFSILVTDKLFLAKDKLETRLHRNSIQFTQVLQWGRFSVIIKCENNRQLENLVAYMLSHGSEFIN